jgi:hypothetical protein
MVMTQIANDGLWLLKILNSCKTNQHLETAKKCCEQFEIKWNFKIEETDEKSLTLFKNYKELLYKHYNKIDKKLSVK